MRSSPDDLTNTPRQTACDIAYAAFAVWATLKVFAIGAANADFLFAWTKVFPSFIAPWVGLFVGIFYFILLMCLPMMWALIWPRRFFPSSLAVFGAFLIFNGYMYLTAGR